MTCDRCGFEIWPGELSYVVPAYDPHMTMCRSCVLLVKKALERKRQ